MQGPHDELRRTFWDGNETWLVLSGGVFGGLSARLCDLDAGALHAGHPDASGSHLSGVWHSNFDSRPRNPLYLGLLLPLWIYRGRFHAGMILGAFVKGVQVEGRSFAGHPFDWLTPTAS